MAEQRFDPTTHMRNGRREPKSPEHKAKIAEALRRYHAEYPDSHVRHQPRGAANPRFVGGRYQQIAFADRPRVCERCGSERHINVHHRDGDRRNWQPENLEVLCRSCHNKAHGLGGHHG